MELISGLDRSLREWGKKNLFLALERWRSRIWYRCAYLANRGYKLQAAIQENLSEALLEGLNPKLNAYLYEEDVNKSREGK